MLSESVKRLGIRKEISSDISIIGEKFRSLINTTEVLFKEHRLRVSVSVGITAIRPEDTIETIVERADALMYNSKKNGKNRVSFD